MKIRRVRAKSVDTAPDTTRILENTSGIPFGSVRRQAWSTDFPNAAQFFNRLLACGESDSLAHLGRAVHDAVGVQAPDLGVAEPENVGEDLVGVLAEQRRAADLHAVGQLEAQR